MALRWIDSFDTYVTADISRRYVESDCAISAADPKNGIGCIYCAGYGDKFTVDTTFTDGKFVLGFHMKLVQYPFTSDSLIGFYSTATINAYMKVTANGTIQFTNAGGTALCESSAGAIDEDVWHHIEIKGEIADATSIDCIIKVDGTVVATAASPVDSLASGTFNRVTIGHIGSNVYGVYFDNLYICDMSGAQCNDFLGECIVEAIMPDGAGYNSDFDGSDGNKVDNHLLVDEVDPDDDTTYVEDSDVGGIDAFTYGALSQTPAAIYGVAVNTMVRKTTENARTMKQIARPVSTNYEGSEHTLTTTYTTFQDIWELNPADAAAWEEADVNGSEFGVKVEA